MIKYCCDVCGAELSAEELKYCNEMIGYGIYCFGHMPEKDNVSYKITLPKLEKRLKKIDKMANDLKANGRTYKRDSSGFLYPED